mgnify:CR=1 FL=1
MATPINGGAGYTQTNDHTLALTATNLRTLLNKRLTYKDRDGKAGDCLALLKRYGHNIARIRLYDKTGPGTGNDGWYWPAGSMDLPDVLARWAQRDGAERQRSRTEQSFCVPKADIAANGYDLSIYRYKEVVHAQVQHRAPSDILAELAQLEDEIAAGMKALEGMLK